MGDHGMAQPSATHPALAENTHLRYAATSHANEMLIKEWLEAKQELGELLG